MTTAMGAAHEVEYTLFVRVDTLDKSISPAELPNLVWEKSMELLYAEGFAVEYYQGGYALINVCESARYMVVPQDMPVPEGFDPSTAIPQQPLENIYLAASSAMTLFDSLDVIWLSGTAADGWYIENAKAAMERGDILFVGKYSEPDFGLLLTQGCDPASNL